MAFPPVLLNIDAGESPDEAEGLYGMAHIVNIACGGHAGDDTSMDRVLAACARFGTKAGAHPSYADRAGFGRTEVRMSAVDVEAMVAEQIERLAARARAAGRAVSYVKPHGALYHAANREPELARAVVSGGLHALRTGFILIGPPKGELRRAAEAAGVAFAREGFADRAMKPDGSLVPRSVEGAVIKDPERARTIARQFALSGTVDTVCVHGDTPAALIIGHAVREALDALNEVG